MNAGCPARPEFERFAMPPADLERWFFEMAEPGASTVYYSGCPSFSKPPAALKAAQALYEAGFAILVQRRRGPNWFDYTIIKRVKPVAAKAPEPVGRR